MKVTSAEFIKSCASVDDLPAEPLPAIAFAGRSNVGKSSLINTLINRKGLVKTSKTPGKTQQINFFKINNRVYFVDLPGYGYAKVPEKVRAMWGSLIEGYLAKGKILKGLVLLIDIRLGLTELDIKMKEWLDYYKIPTIFIATKADKVPYGKRTASIKGINEGLSVDEKTLVIPFSSRTGEGKEILWREILRLLSLHG